MNDLETRIRKANLRYRKDKLAIIQKLEVPIRMTTQGMVATLSTVDFYGEYSYTINGAKIAVPIAFEAKETLSNTSFPLANIHQHQLEYLKLWTHIGGDGFFLIHFKKLYPDQAFVTPVELVDSYWNTNKRKSIPIADFDKTWLIEIDDYLNGIITKKYVTK
jgi:recombination protein U